MNIVLETLFLRRPKIDYLSPAVCEATFSSGGGHYISGSGGSLIFVPDEDGNGGGSDGGGSDGGGGGSGFFNTRQCVIVECPAGGVGDPVTVCKEAGTFVGGTQVEADAAAQIAALAEATALLNCTCEDGFVMGQDGRCIPVCLEADEDAPYGYFWDVAAGPGYVIAATLTEKTYAVGLCIDFTTFACIKDFTGISSLAGGIPNLYAPNQPEYPPDPEPTCADIINTYGGPNVIGANNAEVHPEYVFGDGVDPAREYQVLIRVRGVMELKDYAVDAVDPIDGVSHSPFWSISSRWPNQSIVTDFVWAIDPFVTGTISFPLNYLGQYHLFQQYQNEYAIRVLDVDTGLEYIYMLNNIIAGGGPQTQSVDYLFSIPVKKGWGISVWGTSVNLRQYQNPASFGGPFISVGGAPRALKVTEPYNGQFFQLDVIGITYTP